ncbi:MAG TPA: hypothetical protein VFK41_00915, partial [Nocardioidaceae bacterium]|nr:hypothetical protein [Nocardioidaceae bacterium]
MAGNEVGQFEIEGNTKDDTGPGDPLDWASAAPTVALTPFTDGTGKSDDSFGMGSKQEEPQNWSCINGPSPQKGDITPGGNIGFRTIGDDQYVYMNFTRKATEGSADIDFEFNKSTELNPSCPALPKRSVGDLVIAFDADNGGKVILVRVFEWNGSTFVQSDKVPPNSKGTLWDGATNGDGTNKTGNFGEAVLNLTQTIGDVTCGEFSTVFMKSRSSVEINSALQDRTAKKPVQTGACPDSSVVKKVRNASVTNSQFADTASASSGNTLQYQLTYTNNGPVTANSVVVTDVIQGNQTYVASSCSPNTQTQTCSYDDSKKTVTWNLGNVASKASVVMTFSTTLGTFTSSATVKNVAVVDTAQEEPKNSNETTVNVTAVPNTNGVKNVRNVTTNGQFGTSATASPGDTLEYRIAVTNSGNGPATGIVKDTISGNQTYVPGSCAGGTSCS